MPMSYCRKCLENSWTFLSLEERRIATCNFCGNEYEFEKQRAIVKEGEPCRKCKTPVFLGFHKKLRSKHLQQAYLFKSWLKCPTCKTFYFSEEKKVVRGSDEWKEYVSSFMKNEREPSGMFGTLPL